MPAVAEGVTTRDLQIVATKPRDTDCRFYQLVDGETGSCKTSVHSVLLAPYRIINNVLAGNRNAELFAIVGTLALYGGLLYWGGSKLFGGRR
jgi:hypothetical protein